ncbi:MAG: glycosyltransferase family 9 protein [Candidatus Omnitrophica bacterium]|nr:glycosyltransferase family 9 protein [Candidatus Omnitrophota bacterium]
MGFLLTHKIEDKKYLGLKHEIEYNLELVSLIGAKTDDKSLDIKVDIEADLPQIKGAREFIAIHPWTSDPIKQWQIENFVELAKKVSANNNLSVIIIGGKEHEEESKKYFSNLGNNTINLTGKTNLIQLASLLKRCRLLVSGDSGPVHLASCVATPVIALFRSDIPAKSSKRWGPKGIGDIVIEREELSRITVEEVLEKINNLLFIKKVIC